ncbi:MAG: bifunctional 4-hydroxy-2-oxoglutarate aldolase/2-dehydro-3-deoxy-phosphogluconate aldolase [Scytolyngbya sp. HA4215-MV1]|jgi:2-dehydro-3-deoxyphosphogluconate aldolase/(4S)-4-hydroxy-2-oxoglutarate aldolase|nr:bifunctional 4-hydroxy-2-oxoglutarate aldolase/2-dehydro-3-deoxy-phosphogluconate aldolase [Scytolyngbya sp. HA4215-MV1]
MQTQTWLQILRSHRAIAVIRTAEIGVGYQMAQAVARGGMHLIEITWNSDRPAELIRQLRLDLKTCLIGAGTLLDRNQAQQAIVAGAQFLFTPHVDIDLIRLAIAQQVPIVPGALSPSEIVAAWQAGASSVKVFPIQTAGGATYLRSLQGPLGQIPLIPTGGVTLDNASELLAAGAIAVGLSGCLFPKTAIVNADWQTITQQAQVLTQRLLPYQEKESAPESKLE